MCKITYPRCKQQLKETDNSTLELSDEVMELLSDWIASLCLQWIQSNHSTSLSSHNIA